MSKNIVETSKEEQDSTLEATLQGAQSFQDIDQDKIETAFYSALYGDKGQKINIGGLKIWMTDDDILNYKIIAPSEINGGILSILAAMSLMKDITLNEIKLKEKILTVDDDNVKILNYFYRLIELIDFERVNYIKDIIEQSDGKFDVNTARQGYDSPLVYALKRGTTLDMIQCLVEDFDCDVNTLDQDGHSPLYHALNMKQDASFKSMIIEYLTEVQATLTANEESQLTEQVTLDIEVVHLGEEAYINDLKHVFVELAITAINKATKGETNVPFEDTGFILNMKENGKLEVLYNLGSEVFASLLETASKQGVEPEFIYDKHRNHNVYKFTGNSHEDLIAQVLESDKSLFVSQIDLILQKNESNIECFCSQKTFKKLKILYDIIVQMGLAPTYEELGYNDVMPQELWLAGEMDLPD